MEYKKKYEKLVDAVKVLRDNNPSDEGIQNWVNDNVPELESEDEKIKKEIIEYIKTGTYHKKWVAWLEKQGNKPQGKSALEAIREEKVDNVNKIEPKDYSSIDPHFGKPIDNVEPKFKDGDIVVTTLGNIAIIRKPIGGELFSMYGIMVGNYFYEDETAKVVVERHAAEEEKQKLFKAIKENGYKWNKETKTLEKLPKFKAGDVLVSENGNIVLLSHIDSENIVNYHCIIPTYGSFRIEENTSIGVGRYYECVLANEQQRQRMYDKIKCSGYKYNQNTNKLEKLVKPNFKVGDKIEQKNSACTTILITNVGDEFYYSNTEGSVGVLPISEQDDWELVPNKFDINTLVPFESKVLCRDNNKEKWKSNFWGFYDNDHSMNHPHECCGNTYRQCIPYEGNEHLLGKKDDCDDFYKTWE